MNKQILYPGFITRFIALIIDLFCISLIVSPINQFLNPIIFKTVFADFLHQNNIDVVNFDVIIELFKDSNFQSHMKLSSFIYFILLINMLYFILLFCYLIVTQTRYSSSIGQKLLGLKVVDYSTFEKASMWQIINRSIFIWLGLLSLPTIIFSKQKRGLHDLIASTIVIKR